MTSSLENLGGPIPLRAAPLVIPDSVKLVAQRLGLTLMLTSRVAPEQYEISLNGQPSGYVRARWGGMSVCFPDAGGEELYVCSVDGFAGLTDDEREAQLLLALGLIAARIIRK